MRILIVNKIIDHFKVVKVIVFSVFSAELPLDQALQAWLLDLTCV